MSSIRELNQLQGLDLEIASRRGMLEEIDYQLDDTAALQELRERASQERHNLVELERQQRPVEWEVESTQGLLKEVESKLYGGKVNNPKELMGLQQEATSLKNRQRQQEDAVLEVMTQLEAQQALCSELEKALAEAEQERKELEDRLHAQRRQLMGEVEQLTAQREALAASVPPKDLQLYGSLLVTKQGRALAHVERAMCQGCRINLPMTIQQRVRTGQGLVQCPSCGRLLYVE